MIETFKEVLSTSFEEWRQDILKSGDAKTIDISKAFIEIMARNIFIITLGQDITGDQMDLMCKKDKHSNSLTPKKVKIPEAILECFE